MRHIQKEIKTRNLIIRLRSDGIIETRNRPGWDALATEANARENMAAIVEISAGKLHPTLNYLPEHRVDDAAQKYYANHPRVSIASALIAKTMMQTLLGNVLISIRKLSAPTRIFNNKKDALDWLKAQEYEYLKKNLTNAS